MSIQEDPMTSSFPKWFTFPLLKYSIFLPSLGWTHQPSIPEVCSFHLTLKTNVALNNVPSISTTSSSSTSPTVLSSSTKPKRSHHPPTSILLVNPSQCLNEFIHPSCISIQIESKPYRILSSNLDPLVLSFIFSNSSFQSHSLEIVQKDQHCAFRWVFLNDNGPNLPPSSSILPHSMSQDNPSQQFVKLQLKFHSRTECDVFYNSIQHALKNPQLFPLSTPEELTLSQTTTSSFMSPYPSQGNPCSLPITQPPSSTPSISTTTTSNNNNNININNNNNNNNTHHQSPPSSSSTSSSSFLSPSQLLPPPPLLPSWSSCIESLLLTSEEELKDFMHSCLNHDSFYKLIEKLETTLLSTLPSSSSSSS